MELAGARVLLTGATGGLGRAIATDLSAAGASLVLSGRRADALADLAAATGASVLTADLADPSAPARLADDVGPVDILVANAALPASGLLEDYDEERIDRCLDVNLRAAIVLAHRLTPAMVGRGRGHVVVIGSLSGLAAAPGSSLYSATKFGLRGFALGLRQDLHGTGVGVSVVEPGFVAEAGMFADSGARLPPGTRLATPTQVSGAVRRAITRDRAEVLVAPPELRLGARLSTLAPGPSAWVTRLLGGRRVAASIAAGQQDKR